MSGKKFEEFVVRDRIGREEVEDLIDGYATINIEEGLIQFQEGFKDTSKEIQLLIPLLALYAFKVEGEAEPAAMDPVDLANITDNSVGDAYPVIRELEQEGLIENVGKEYRIVPDAQDKIKSKFQSSGNTNTACA